MLSVVQLLYYGIRKDTQELLMCFFLGFIEPFLIDVLPLLTEWDSSPYFVKIIFAFCLGFGHTTDRTGGAILIDHLPGKPDIGFRASRIDIGGNRG